MSYEPTNWKDGDLVTSAKLNKMEQGIAASGGGALESLSDVDLSNPTNGQTLVYNGTSGKWENSSGGGSVLTVHITNDITNGTANLDKTYAEIYEAAKTGTVIGIEDYSDEENDEIYFYRLMEMGNNSDGYYVSFDGKDSAFIASTKNDYPEVSNELEPAT